MLGITRVTRILFYSDDVHLILGSASTWNVLIPPSILCILHSDLKKTRSKSSRAKFVTESFSFSTKRWAFFWIRPFPLVSYSAEIWSWKPLHDERVAVILLKMYRYPISCTFLPPYKPPNLFAVTRAFLNPDRGGVGRSSNLCIIRL